MKASTITGIILGTLAIFGAYLIEGGSLTSLFMIPALIIVIGGTLAAGLASTSFAAIMRMPTLIYKAVNPPIYDLNAIILQLVRFATLARHEGILSIESKLDTVAHPYMRKLFETMIDGADPQSLEYIAQIEINYITERHISNINLFTKLGGYSPTMGIIGTVMGLISTLAAAGGNPIELIQHISTAFIATLWGIFMANIVWFPIGDKLRMLHEEEIQVLQIMFQGVQSVQAGEVPTVIYSKLISVFPLSVQAKMDKVPAKMMEDKHKVPNVSTNPFSPDNDAKPIIQTQNTLK